jgi:hypothetical protein
VVFIGLILSNAKRPALAVSPAIIHVSQNLVASVQANAIAVSLREVPIGLNAECTVAGNGHLANLVAVFVAANFELG